MGFHSAFKGLMTGLRADRTRNVCWICSTRKRLSPAHNLQTHCRTYPAPCPVGTGAKKPEGEAYHSPLSNDIVKNACLSVYCASFSLYNSDVIVSFIFICCSLTIFHFYLYLFYDVLSQGGHVDLSTYTTPPHTSHVSSGYVPFGSHRSRQMYVCTHTGHRI